MCKTERLTQESLGKARTVVLTVVGALILIGYVVSRGVDRNTEGGQETIRVSVDPACLRFRRCLRMALVALFEVGRCLQPSRQVHARRQSFQLLARAAWFIFSGLQA
jgi:hypothetical protein